MGKIEGIAKLVKDGDKVFFVGPGPGRVRCKVLNSRANNSIRVEGGLLRFAEMIELDAGAMAADIGAPVLTEARELIGMVYLTGIKTTVVIPIDSILKALEVKLLR